MSLGANVAFAGMALSLTGCVFAAVGPLAVVVPAALVAAGAAKLVAESPDPGEPVVAAHRAAHGARVARHQEAGQ